MDVGPFVQTASELDICTCCNSSQRPEPRGRQGDHLRGGVSHSRTSSVPDESMEHKADQ